LISCGLLAGLTAAALVVQALALGSALADVVTRSAWPGGWLAVLAGAVIARSVLAWATETVAARAAAGAKEELRSALLDRSLRLGPEWIAGRGPAELTVLATKGLDALDAYFTRYLPALVAAVVVPPLVGLWVLLTDPTSAALVLITLPLIPVFAILIGLYTKGRVARAADVTERLSGNLLELLHALPVLTAFGRARSQAEAVRRIGEQHRKATMGTLRVAFLSALVLEVAASLSVALIAVGIGLRLVSGEMALVTALVVLILAPECYLPLRAAGAAHHASEDGLEAVRRVADVLDEPVRSGPTVDVATPAPRRVHSVEVGGLKVRRRDGFAPDGESFMLRAGEIHRLDAPSGAGKSTTLAALLGFVTPEAGRITADGVDLSTWDLSTWRRCVAWVPQHPAFAAATPAGELALAVADQPGGAPRREELCAVAAEVAADHLLDRPIDRLSTGERQRVAVARALLRTRRGASVLLLDEPTAHLDAATATRVNAAVRRAAGAGAAVLLVTHRIVAPEESETPQPVVAAPGEEDVAAEPRLRTLLTARSLAGALLGVAALGAGVALTAVAAYLIARAWQQPPILTLSVLVVGVRAFALAKGMLRYLERLVSHDAAFRLAESLRLRLWDAVVRLGPARQRRDDLQRLVDDTDAVRDLVPRVLLPPLVAAGVGTGAVLLNLLLLPEAGLALAAALVIGGLVAPAVAVAVERRASTALASGRRRVAVDVLTLLRAAPDLIASGAHERRRADLAAADARLAVQARRQALGAGAASAVVHLTIGLSALVCTALAATAVGDGRLNPILAPVLGLVPLALAEALAALPQAAQQRGALASAYGRLDVRVSEQDRVPASGERVRLDGVDVRWPGAEEPALRDVTLDFRPGARIAVLGPSGAGKSTLLALLLGFLPVERGSAELPRRVSWCPQEPRLVSTTVRENLRMADPHATDDALRDALVLAGLPDWTDRLDVLLGSGGAALSGGEAQRMALARALLHDADLVLLDEPTAHLDEPTAQALLKRLDTVLRGKTVVHVTHRPEEAAGADLVLGITGGRVAQRAYR
jgi:ATP-binding cassette subfamily C protein CydCD